MRNLRILSLSALALPMLAPSAMAADNVPVQVAATLGNTLYYETVDGNFRLYILSSPSGTYRGQSSMKMNGQGGEWRSMDGVPWMGVGRSREISSVAIRSIRRRLLTALLFVSLMQIIPPKWERFPRGWEGG